MAIPQWHNMLQNLRPNQITGIFDVYENSINVWSV
jgi:hypothetical protein